MDFTTVLCLKVSDKEQWISCAFHVGEHRGIIFFVYCVLSLAVVTFHAVDIVLIEVKNVLRFLWTKFKVAKGLN